MRTGIFVLKIDAFWTRITSPIVTQLDASGFFYVLDHLNVFGWTELALVIVWRPMLEEVIYRLVNWSCCCKSLIGLLPNVNILILLPKSVRLPCLNDFRRHIVLGTDLFRTFTKIIRMFALIFIFVLFLGRPLLFNHRFRTFLFFFGDFNNVISLRLRLILVIIWHVHASGTVLPNYNFVGLNVVKVFLFCILVLLKTISIFKHLLDYCSGVVKGEEVLI